MKRAKLIHPKDNVATCLSDCEKGEQVLVMTEEGAKTYTLLQDIALGHKFAITAIDQGAYVMKYGEPIGRASVPIETGEWVHIHNVKDHYEVK